MDELIVEDFVTAIKKDEDAEILLDYVAEMVNETEVNILADKLVIEDLIRKKVEEEITQMSDFLDFLIFQDSMDDTIKSLFGYVNELVDKDIATTE